MKPDNWCCRNIIEVWVIVNIILLTGIQTHIHIYNVPVCYPSTMKKGCSEQYLSVAVPVANILRQRKYDGIYAVRICAVLTRHQP